MLVIEAYVFAKLTSLQKLHITLDSEWYIFSYFSMTYIKEIAMHANVISIIVTLKQTL